MARFTELEWAVVWDRCQAGDSMRAIARELGRQASSVRTLIENTGGVRPRPQRRAPRHLSLGEREEISRENAVSRIDPAAALDSTGRFAQISGFSFAFDTTGTAMLIASDGTVLIPGTWVQTVTLDDGTVIVSGGVVQGGPDLTVATIDFLARGGDQYPYGGAPFTSVGVSHQANAATTSRTASAGTVLANPIHLDPRSSRNGRLEWRHGDMDLTQYVIAGVVLR